MKIFADGPNSQLVEIRIPLRPGNTGWSFLEFSRRHGDFAIVAAAILLSLEADGRCREARIGLGGIAPTPIRAEEAEGLLAGRNLTEALINKAGEKAAEAAEPESDYHASAEYRRDLARVFTQRGLKEAWNRIKGGK